jgi:hypothetical protein
MIVLPQASSSESFPSTGLAPAAATPAAIPGASLAGTAENAGDFSEHMSQALSGFPSGANATAFNGVSAPAAGSPSAMPDASEPPDLASTAVPGPRSTAHARTSANPNSGTRPIRAATSISSQPVTATTVSGGKSVQGTRQKPSKDRDSKDAQPSDPSQVQLGLVPMPPAAPLVFATAVQATSPPAGASAAYSASEQLTAGQSSLSQTPIPPMTATRETGASLPLALEVAGKGAGDDTVAKPSPNLAAGSQTVTAPASEANGHPQAAGPPGGRFVADMLQAGGASSQPDSSGTETPSITGANATVAPDGTTAALGNQRMKSAAEKNKIAGSTVQILPSTPSDGGASAEAGGRLQGQGMPRSAVRSQGDADTQPIINFQGKSLPVGADAPQVPSGQTLQVPDHSAQLERTAELITREVVMVKQSGLNSLAVSLKPDSQTELFLQVSNHDGQLQASLRCERGDISGLASQWGQLQESLARHNVQLLPLEDRSAQRPQSFNPHAGSTANRDFNQQPSSQNPQRQSRELPEEPFVAAQSIKPGRAQKTVTKTSARQGWESWA